jgi:hypothetical protein
LEIEFRMKNFESGLSKLGVREGERRWSRVE